MATEPGIHHPMCVDEIADALLKRERNRCSKCRKIPKTMNNHGIVFSSILPDPPDVLEREPVLQGYNFSRITPAWATKCKHRKINVCEIQRTFRIYCCKRCASPWPQRARLLQNTFDGPAGARIGSRDNMKDVQSPPRSEAPSPTQRRIKVTTSPTSFALTPFNQKKRKFLEARKRYLA